MINLFYFMGFLIFAISAVQVLAWRYPKNWAWEATDYFWYCLAAASLFLFVVDVNQRSINHSIENELALISQSAESIIIDGLA